jgi:N-acetylmuramoyl-L-alanine amidase
MPATASVSASVSVGVSRSGQKPWLEMLGLALTLALTLCSCATRPLTSVKGIPGHFSTVIVDAGHGGKDNGGLGGRRGGGVLREKDLTLSTAKKVRAELQRAGVNTVMIRDDDRFVELDDRVAFANRQGTNAILVSIHYDATGDRGANGAKTYFWRADSHGLATRIQESLVAETGETNLGVLRRRLRLTRNPEIRSVLCECAYLTNPTEAQKVTSGAYQSRIATGIAKGILEQYRLGDAGITSVPELIAPMSRASDKYVGRRSRHHRKHHKQV